MTVDAWHLPWGKETVPHGLLDVIRGCNISCNACYNSLPPSVSTMPEIEAELKMLMTHRRLGSVSVVGGEVLLHPELCHIIRLIKKHGFCAQIYTNGLLLDERMLGELKEAGLDIISLHIERGQNRSDLPKNASFDQLRELWEAKAALIARHGIDVGLTMTAFEHNLEEVYNIVSFVNDSPHVNYLLITLFRDTDSFNDIRGGLLSGELRGTLCDPSRKRTDTLTNTQLSRLLRERLRLRPFGFLGSNRDAKDPRWLSYLIATRRNRRGDVVKYAARASAFEKAYLGLSLQLAGKYPMYRRQSTSQLIVHLMLNALTGGDFWGNMKFLFGSLLSPGRLGAKRLLLQCPAEVEADGTIVHCKNCPDAVVKNGELVPVCLADKVARYPGEKQQSHANKSQAQ
jgi:pyruvate-formate lyase-activating enzyme